MKIGEKIREIRTKKRLSVDNMAQHLNVSRQAIYYWEQGKSNPSLELLDSIASFLGIDVKYLVNYSTIDLEPVNEESSVLDKTSISYYKDLISDKEKMIVYLIEENKYLKKQNEETMRMLSKY